MKNNKWSIAAIDGLLLALITIIVTLIQTVLEPGKILNIILWFAKLIGCIGLLYYFVKDYGKNQVSFTYKQGLNFGFIICLLSSVICASYLFLHYALIFPESLDLAMENIATAMKGSGGDTSMLDKIQAYLPHFVFGVSLVYYTLFGLLVSSIIANYTKKEEVFPQE